MLGNAQRRKDNKGSLFYFAKNSDHGFGLGRPSERTFFQRALSSAEAEAHKMELAVQGATLAKRLSSFPGFCLSIFYPPTSKKTTKMYRMTHKGNTIPVLEAAGILTTLGVDENRVGAG